MIKLPDSMDAECVELCEAINTIPGIETYESCCGHGESPYSIYFTANHIDALPNLLYWFDGCHCGFYGWQVVAYTDCAKANRRFRIDGPVGNPGYYQSVAIAKLIRSDSRLEGMPDGIHAKLQTAVYYMLCMWDALRECEKEAGHEIESSDLDGLASSLDGPATAFDIPAEDLDACLAAVKENNAPMEVQA